VRFGGWPLPTQRGREGPLRSLAGVPNQFVSLGWPQISAEWYSVLDSRLFLVLTLPPMGPEGPNSMKSVTRNLAGAVRRRRKA